jgi:hypothetical protein
MLDLMNIRTLLAFSTLSLAACDPIGYGYVNQLHRSVTVVHHVHGRDERFTLAAGERRLPRLGDWPGSHEVFFDTSGSQIAAISGEEIKQLKHKDTPPVLVLSPSGITLATRQQWDEWQAQSRSNAYSR